MSQSLSKVYVHIVFSTKERRAFINKEIREELENYIGRVLIDLKCTAEAIKSVEDHIHILCSLSRTISISDLLEEIKKHSSRWIKTRGERYKVFCWQDGYSVFSVSQSLVGKTIQYISNQEEHHKKVAYSDELLKFLKSYKVVYDEKYLWT